MIRVFNTTSGKKIEAALKEHNIHVHESDVIAFNYDEGEPEGYISVNYNSVGIHFNFDEMVPSDLEKDNIKYWGTWNYKG